MDCFICGEELFIVPLFEKDYYKYLEVDKDNLTTQEKQDVRYNNLWKQRSIRNPKHLQNLDKFVLPHIDNAFEIQVQGAPLLNKNPMLLVCTFSHDGGPDDPSDHSDFMLACPCGSVYDDLFTESPIVKEVQLCKFLGYSGFGLYKTNLSNYDGGFSQGFVHRPNKPIDIYNNEDWTGIFIHKVYSDVDFKNKDETEDCEFLIPYYVGDYNFYHSDVIKKK